MTGPWIALFVVLWAVVFLIGSLVLGLINRTSDVLDRLQTSLDDAELGGPMTGRGVSPGSPLPTFSATTREAALLSSAELRGQPAVILFLDPDCGPCQMIAAQLRSDLTNLAGTRLVVIMNASEEAKSMDVGPHLVLFEASGSVSMAFKTAVTPNAFAVSADSRIVDRKIPHDVEDLAQLAREALGGEVSMSAR